MKLIGPPVRGTMLGRPSAPPRTIHVAVDAHNLVRDDRGIGRYARAILRRALDEPDFRWTLLVRDWLPNRAALAHAVGHDAVAAARAVPASADVVWSPWNGTFFTTGLPSVATVHDVTPFAYPAAAPRLRATEQAPFLRTARSARRILVQSEFTAREVVRRLGVALDRIVVIPLAADDAFSPGAPRALPPPLRRTPYVLHVGAHDVRKNTATLCAAFARAFPAGELTLAFTRRPPVLPPGAVVVPAPDDAALCDLYRGALFVCVPSLCEGFGFPLLEALACGAPVLASRVGALPALGGDAAAWVDDPLDVDEWVHALRTLTADGAQRASLSLRGPLRARGYSWERCVAATLAVLRDVALDG